MRLTRIRTTRPASPSVLQDLQYTYDAAGNIVELQDAVAPTVHFNNRAVDPHQQFEYDPWYRLIQATGREHVSQGQPTEHDPIAQLHPDPNSPQALRRYTEHYHYDLVGNITEHRHEGLWTRTYTYANDGNRLLFNSASIGAIPSAYSYDRHGNMTSMLHLTTIDWDHTDHMQHAALGGGGDVYFQYDAAGNRVRKMWVNDSGALTRERIYLDGFEIFRERVNGDLRSERETLHITDDTDRILMIESLTVNDANPVAVPASLFRYQYGNHLGSVSLELDDGARVISYEELLPYGTCAYRAVASGIEVSANRYRYIGVERDNETGLDHMGARYYAPWLGRWIAVDPIGLGDGANRFAYARGNPIGLRDPKGTQCDPAITTCFEHTEETGQQREVLHSSSDSGQVSQPMGKYEWTIGEHPGYLGKVDTHGKIIFPGTDDWFESIGFDIGPIPSGLFDPTFACEWRIRKLSSNRRLKHTIAVRLPRIVVEFCVPGLRVINCE